MSSSLTRQVRPTCERLECRIAPAVLTVTTTDDTLAGGFNSDSTPILSLRAAILQANATPGADTILLPAGRYALTIPGRDEAGGRTGDLNIVGDLTIRGAGAATTIVDASGLDRALNIAPSGTAASTVAISGLTIRGGRTVANVIIDSGQPDGAGILVVGSTLDLSASVVTGNTSGREGGGITVRDGHLNLTASTIFGNISARDGGGISLSGGIDPTRSATVAIVNSTISDNTATRSGGGIKLFSPDGTKSSVDTVNATIFGNGAASGGNISNTASNALGIGGNVSLTNTIVAGASSGGNYDAPRGLTSRGGNLEDADTLKLRQSTDQFLTPTGLGPLQDNGGPTPTRAISATSAAKDRAITSAAPAVDQLGTPRPQGIAADVGAYELIPTAAVVAATPGTPATPTFATVSTARLTAVGAAAGSSQVNVYNSDGTIRISFDAFEGFRGGVHVTTADFNGDGTDDIIVGAGAGGGPHVKVFDGKTFAMIASFFAFDAAFTGGVEVAAGDLDRDGKAEIVVGAGPGGGPHVKVFHGGDLAPLASFFAYSSEFRGGITVGVDADARAIVTGAGKSGGPHVEVFDGASFALRSSFLAFDSAYAGGVSVAAANGVLAVGMLSSAPSEVRLYSPSGTILNSFNPFESGFGGGVRLGVGGTAIAPTFLVGVASRGGPAVRSYSTSGVLGGDFLAFDSNYFGGVTVG